jgi:hypothetical protein
VGLVPARGGGRATRRGVRVRPWAVFGILLAAVLAWGLLDLVRAPFVAVAYAMFHFSAVTPRPRSVRLVTAALLSLGTLGLLTVAGSPRGAPGWWAGRPQHLALFLVVLASAWTVGQITRDRRILVVRAAARSPRSGCGSPASFTTASPTAWE